MNHHLMAGDIADLRHRCDKLMDDIDAERDKHDDDGVRYQLTAASLALVDVLVGLELAETEATRAAGEVKQ